MITVFLVRGAFFGEAGGWERPQFFLPEEKVQIPPSVIIDHRCSQSSWQDLKLEKYDWYGYGETYGSDAELRSNYRYKQVCGIEQDDVS